MDHRTRRERILKREMAFKIQIEAITDAYLLWSHDRQSRGHWVPPSASTDLDFETTPNVPVTIIDIFCKCSTPICFEFTSLINDSQRYTTALSCPFYPLIAMSLRPWSVKVYYLAHPSHHLSPSPQTAWNFIVLHTCEIRTYRFKLGRKHCVTYIQ